LRLRADAKSGKEGIAMSKRSFRPLIALTLASALCSAGPAVAATTRYDPQRAGHPLRIVAYALHPIGVIADTLIFHPAWWLGTHEPLRTLFGVDVVFDDSAEVAREIAEQKAKAAEPPLEPPPPQEPDREPAPPAPPVPVPHSDEPAPPLPD
jgi:hypothetical protein